MKRGGRQPFGFRKKHGVITEVPELIAVARMVIELRDSGLTWDRIQSTDGVCWPDGRKLSVSTICLIVKNRSLYEKIYVCDDAGISGSVRNTGGDFGCEG